MTGKEAFIITEDFETAESLKNDGFVLLSEDDNGRYIFKNDSKKIKNFSKDKLVFTNRLFI